MRALVRLLRRRNFCAATARDKSSRGHRPWFVFFRKLSDDAEIENPRLYRQAQKKLRRAQRRVARRKKGSKRRRKAVVLLRKIRELLVLTCVTEYVR